MSQAKPLTPLMQQYFEIKKEYQDSLLLFQVGDFYELFFDDAKNAASFLGLALTKRGNVNGEAIPLCGVPVHALDHYLSKLIKGGFKIVICDQLEEAVPGKIVKRGISQILTPGTLTDSKLLDSKTASYILFFKVIDSNWSLLFVELLTGQIFATMVLRDDFKTLEAELSRFLPDEIIISSNDKSITYYFKNAGYYTTVFEVINDDSFYRWLYSGSENIKSILGSEQFLEVAALLYSYFLKHNVTALEYIRDIYNYKSEDFLIIDGSTQRNLELVKNNQDNTRQNSLFDLMDYAITSMGSRTIKKWLLRPLVKIEQINYRLDTIEFFVKHIDVKENIVFLLKQIGDLERIVGRIALGKGQLNDYMHLKNSLRIVPLIIDALKPNYNIKLLVLILSKLSNLEQLSLLLENALNDDSSKDWIIKSKFDLRLDEIRSIIQNSHKKILALEQQEIIATEISSLKIRYNDVFGYYIEVTKSNLDAVPEHYKRTQTLSNRERFTTNELKALEIEIEHAKKDINIVEQELYNRIKSQVQNYLSDLKKIAFGLAQLDAIIGLSELAYQNNYVRPVFNTSTIEIKNGRHPIIERSIEKFISNDSFFNEENKLWIVTGPNMGGKSTFLRQIALISIMGQCGSFVSAQYANLKILDKIFTRIGAGDNLAEGKSTFLVEMEETATICKNATQNSLIILDEVGRGTSTFDGIAIAQAVIEFIYNKIGAYCLFATHYHELTELEQKYAGIVAYYASSKQQNGKIVFLHKIEKGVANGSFGLEVAKLAGLSDEIIARASEILITIQMQHTNKVNVNSIQNFESDDLKNKYTIALAIDKNITNIQKKLNNIDLNDITPKEALDFLWKLKENF